MFEDGWRIARDWFYDPDMHGVDWPGMKKRYGALVPFVAHRADLDFILGEMLAELEAGPHLRRLGRRAEGAARAGRDAGRGAGAGRPSGRYRIAQIYPGENWDDAFRSPLTEPGVRGEARAASSWPSTATTCARATTPTACSRTRPSVPVVLKVVGQRGRRRRARGHGAAGVERARPPLPRLGAARRMALADKLSGGKVGYIHLPDTATDGQPHAAEAVLLAGDARPR